LNDVNEAVLLMARYSDHIICIAIQQFYANGTNTIKWVWCEL